jgi:hypothetical protein
MTQFVFGVGSGRSGTQSLARLLSSQPGSHVFHEFVPVLAWRSSVDVPRRAASVSAAAPGATVTGDVASSYLHHVPELLKHLPDMRIICLRREQRATVESFARWTRERFGPTANHWSLDRTGLRDVVPWDDCFPKYPTRDIRLAVAQYWTDYYTIAKDLARRFPASFRIFEMETSLNTRAGIAAILDWARTPECGRILDAVHCHRSKGHRWRLLG